MSLGAIPFFKAEACGNDVALRERVERLLAAQGARGGILQGETPTSAVKPAEPRLLPDRVFAGRFKLRQIAQTTRLWPLRLSPAVKTPGTMAEKYVAREQGHSSCDVSITVATYRLPLRRIHWSRPKPRSLQALYVSRIGDR